MHIRSIVLGRSLLPTLLHILLVALHCSYKSRGEYPLRNARETRQRPNPLTTALEGTEPAATAMTSEPCGALARATAICAECQVRRSLSSLPGLSFEVTLRIQGWLRLVMCASWA